MRYPYLYLFVFVAMTCISQVAWSQLPKPSGRFDIGHYRSEWTDKSRYELLASNDAHRRVVADIWYPAENNSEKNSLYLDTVQVLRAMGREGLRSFFGEMAAGLILSNRVETHALENALFSRSINRAPVLLFSHGMGMITHTYTALLEDLASQGYIVVALTHPYDAWLVSFLDGTEIKFETKQRSAAGATEEQHIAYENKRIEWWAGDIRFAIDQLSLMNDTANAISPFAGRADLAKIGALGHSSGGRAAARACQLDQRIDACADLDGVAMMQPFYLDSNGRGMRQPFLLFERVRNVAPDEGDASSLGMTLNELNALVQRLRAAKEAALLATGGSYHVLLKFDSSSHMSFSDLPLLQAKNDIEAETARKLLTVTCRYTREFFDKTLRGVAAPLYDGNVRLNYIESVRKYGF